MKTNLKTKPKQLVGKKGCADNSGYWEDDVAKWFEDFEKRQRDLLRARAIEIWLDEKQSLGLTAPDAIRLFIKEEILGSE